LVSFPRSFLEPRLRQLLRILLELNVVDDPVWIYFDSQHKHILNFMRSSHERFIELVNGRFNLASSLQDYGVVHSFDCPDAQERLPIRINDPAYGAAQLQPCVAALETKQAESIIGTLPISLPLIHDVRLTNIAASAKANGWEVWEAVLNMVKNLSEIVSNSLPNFWKIAKLYMEGKFKKVSSERRFPQL
jgi:exocyst complex component 2